MNTPATTTGPLPDRTASATYRPSPGHANTVSVSTAPPSSAPVWSPVTVTMGIRALRSAWRVTTRVSGAPFARAVRT